MEKKDLKKLLASLGIASLISSGGMALPGNAKAASGTGWAADKEGAGSAEKVVETTAGSGGSGTKEGAMSAVQEEAEKTVEKAAETAEGEAKKKVDEAAEAVKEEAGKAVEKAAGESGWGGSK